MRTCVLATVWLTGREKLINNVGFIDGCVDTMTVRFLALL